MRINLHDIPKDGQSFELDRQSGELNNILKDLIGETPYQIHFRIQPKPHGYELTGELSTSIPDVCSFCGHEIGSPAVIKVKELLLPEIDQPRTSHYSKPNHYSDLHAGGPSVTYYKEHHFDAGEYFHEAIALEQPMQPACPESDKEACDARAEEVKKLYGEGKTSPFAALKQLKLN